MPRRPTRASTEVAAHGAAPSQRRVRSAMPAARREGLPRTQVSRGSARAPSHGPRGGLGPSPLPSYFPGTPNSPAARPPPPRTPPPPGPRSAFPQGPAGTGRGHVRSGPGSQAGASCPLIPAARSRGARARGARGRGTVRPRRRPRARIRPALTRHADRAASSPQPAAGGDTCSADRSAGERGRGRGEPAREGSRGSWGGCGGLSGGSLCAHPFPLVPQGARECAARGVCGAGSGTPPATCGDGHRGPGRIPWACAETLACAGRARGQWREGRCEPSAGGVPPRGPAPHGPRRCGEDGTVRGQSGRRRSPVVTQESPPSCSV